ncbi:MAG: hypothetical protein ACRC5H_01720 [Treponemataceae bacterium]
MKKLFSLTLICLLSQIYFVLHAQVFERQLAGGGRLTWKNSLSVPFEEEDFDDLVKILETDDDYFEVIFEVINANEFNSEGYKQTTNIIINVKGQSQLKNMYDFNTKKIILDKQLEMLQKLNSFIMRNARHLQDNQYERFISMTRSYKINYTTNLGLITIFGGTSRNESDEIKIYYPIQFRVLDEVAQVYPNLVDGTTQLSLGKPYDDEKLVHLPAYFVYYLFNDHRALFDIPSFNKSFVQY